MNRRALLLIPFGVALAGGGAFYAMLDRMSDGSFDPRGVPSMLINKAVPPFSLSGISGTGLDERGFGNVDLASGQPVIVNFFASWCEPCIEEAPVLLQLKQTGARIYGIAYKDKPADTAAYLRRHGNPYDRLASDPPGRVAIDWGITGVPETYLIDGKGIVRWRFVGPIPPPVAENQVPALLRKYV
jgi:cytochrome c biogenesis protein CcmG/thiol:disulfide interchange protein DsbE